MSTRWQRREVTIEEWSRAVEHAAARPGWRFGHLTARGMGGVGSRVLGVGTDRTDQPDRSGRSSPTPNTQHPTLFLEALLLDTAAGGGEIIAVPLPPGAGEFPSLTSRLPAAHWAERAAGEMFGLVAHGHPRWKSLLLHEAWPRDFAPLRDTDQALPPDAPPKEYAFLEVKGEGVHEIPVGPIHAGIIEPGHFRFSCLGEVIANLEIRLGYLHRGVERRLQEIPWQRPRFVAEAASSDTAVGNALAHAVAIEQLLEVTVPPRAQALRTMALEIERLASHLGDMGGLSADIGYSAGSALFARLRGQALGLGELLTGTRFQRSYVLPGGVARDLCARRRASVPGSPGPIGTIRSTLAASAPGERGRHRADGGDRARLPRPGPRVRAGRPRGAGQRQ